MEYERISCFRLPKKGEKNLMVWVYCSLVHVKIDDSDCQECSYHLKEMYSGETSPEQKCIATLVPDSFDNNLKRDSNER